MKRIIQNQETKEYMNNDGEWFTPTTDNELKEITDQSEYFHSADIFTSTDDSVVNYDEVSECMIELVLNTGTKD